MKRTDTDHVESGSVAGSTALSGVSRYDLVLGVIPLALSASAVGASVSDLPLEPVLAAGALVALLAMVDALFVNPPSADAGREHGDVHGSRRRRTG